MRNKFHGSEGWSASAMWCDRHHILGLPIHTEVVILPLDIIRRCHMIKAVKNCPGYFVTDAGELFLVRKINAVNAGKTKQTAYVEMFANGKRKRVVLGRLVLETFVGPCPKNMECCHGPNGRADHSLRNLSWGTHIKNCTVDKERDGTLLRGDESPSAKLNSLQVRIIRRTYGKRNKNGLSCPQLADVFGTTYKNIWAIVNRKSWFHIDTRPRKQ